MSGGKQSGFRPVVHMELREDAGDVVLDRLLADIELGRDLRAALGDATDHLGDTTGRIFEVARVHPLG